MPSTLENVHGSLDKQRPKSSSTTFLPFLQAKNPARRLRPLSALTTTVTCDTAKECLRRESVNEASSKLSDLHRPASAYSLDSVARDVSESVCEESAESGYNTRPSSSACSTYSELDLSIHSKDLRACLERLSPMTQEATEAEIIEAVNQLYEILKTKQLMENKKWRGRTPVLKALFGALNPNHPKAAIRISTVCIALRLSGKNLCSLFQFLKEVCRSGRCYIDYTLDDDFLTQLVSVANMVSVENERELAACVLEVLNCAARNSDEVRHKLTELGIMTTLRKFMSYLSAISHQEKTSLLVLKITENTVVLLRTEMDVGRSVRLQFKDLNLVPLIVKLFDSYSNHKDVVLHCSRIFSSISMYEEFCDDLLIAEPDFLHTISKSLNMYYDDQDIAVRLLFAIGNLLSINNKAQWHLYQERLFYSCVLKTFQYYMSLFKEEAVSEESMNATGSSKCETEDILIKLVRLIANILVHEGVGMSICLDETLLTYLLLILDSASLCDQENPELILNTLTTLHNLSFYRVQDSAIQKYQQKISEAVYPCLMDSNLRVAAEACNVIGNLSRYPDVQRWLIDRKIHIMMVSLLDSSSSELASSSCGILINLSLTSNGCRELQKHQTLEKKLLHLLNENAQKNWFICSLGCKLFWNLLIYHCCSEQTKNKTVEWLLKNTDETTSICNDSLPEDLKQQLTTFWEDEFYPIATDLLMHISNIKMSKESHIPLNF